MNDFLAFVVERHRIWEKRQVGLPAPWTDDPVLATRKFTNVFRILDPGTQFVLTDLFEPGLSERDQLMRLFLYRHTGRIEAWKYLDVFMGDYPTVSTMREVRDTWQEYRGGFTQKERAPWSSPDKPPNRLGKTFERPVFTSAYIVFPGTAADSINTDKLDTIFERTRRLFEPGSPTDVMPAWERATSQAERFHALRSGAGVGDFMAMQVLTDWTYQGGEDREDEFLVPGPGSIKGAKAIDPTAKTMDVVRRVVEQVRALPDCPRVGYRVPSLMDIGSNLLCEWSKYDRYRGQAVPTKTYKPAHPGPQPDLVLPSYYTEDLL